MSGNGNADDDKNNNEKCNCLIPFLNNNLQGLANSGCVISVMSTIFFIHGLIIQYFYGTHVIWKNHFHITENFFHILKYVDHVFVGLVALILAYLGQKYGKLKWIGSLVIYLAISCFLLILPEIYGPKGNNSINSTNIRDRLLCDHGEFDNITVMNETYSNNEIMAYLLFIIYQLLYSVCTVSLFCHAISYIDDHLLDRSPIFMGLFFLMYSLGKQAGLYSSWLIYFLNQMKVFTTTVWLSVISVLCICGIIMTTFPNSLSKVASGDSDRNPDGFFQSVLRILKNKIFLFNLLAIVLVDTTLTNFQIFENIFVEAKYHLRKDTIWLSFNDSLLLQILSNHLEQPIIAASYIITGLIITYLRPSASRLIRWNLLAFLSIFIGFSLTMFLKCDVNIKTEYSHALTLTYCSSNCSCSLDSSFRPVCLNGATYFSPCYAGCRTYNNERNVYQDCLCGVTTQTATNGTCNQNCHLIWILAQINYIICRALFAMACIITLFIILRVVLTKDKALALGMYLTLFGHISYITRIFYDAIKGKFCEINGSTKCLLYSNSFTILLASCTLCILGLAIIITAYLWHATKNIALYDLNHNQSSVESEDDSPNNNTTESHTLMENASSNNASTDNVGNEDPNLHQPLFKSVGKGAILQTDF
ncbi:hypothetical protein GWI33_014432 [Rhynchophorus ferrugineus]|uniref:Kazal-like domain-containing protein n=1 Tax=Rhynchophorus ferrugineus TaxID=354439 RepID=A0A834I766_RHYFE|nr:hypothetical protein GWI33_014432 [Rhynchophorus ferrugineus]